MDYNYGIIITISIALLGAGCLSNGVSITDNDKWMPPFEGLQWGMSEAEVMNVLGLTETDLERNSGGFVSKKEYDLFGVKKNVGFSLQVGEDALITIAIL